MMLEVDNLSAGYGRIPILNNVTFSVAAGEFIGVLGHNGMGKTTLLRTLMGYLPATSGRVTFEGADLTRAEPYVRARAGIGLGQTEMVGTVGRRCQIKVVIPHRVSAGPRHILCQRPIYECDRAG